MKSLALILVVIGALNWGLAIFGVDIGTWGLGDMVNKIIYALVALSGLYLIYDMMSGKKPSQPMM